MKIGESPDNDRPLPDDPTASHLQALIERCSASFADLGSSTARNRGRTETEGAPPSLTPARDGTVRVVETTPANFNITTRHDHRAAAGRAQHESTAFGARQSLDRRAGVIARVVDAGRNPERGR
jgi:hypothetical protein